MDRAIEYQRINYENGIFNRSGFNNLSSMLLFKGTPEERDYQAALEYGAEWARVDDMALYGVASTYRKGLFVEQDLERAKQAYRGRAQYAGSPFVKQSWLSCYPKRSAVVKAYPKAYKLLTILAERL